VLGVLGNGGMGRVLRAHDAEHSREVALKVLHPQWAQDENDRSRFRREAQIAARLNEPHVIPIHRYGEIDGQLFLDMRLVEGENLDSLLRRGGPTDPAGRHLGRAARAPWIVAAAALVAVVLLTVLLVVLDGRPTTRADAAEISSSRSRRSRPARRRRPPGTRARRRARR
jgi:serine/threonine-protein kinase